MIQNVDYIKLTNGQNYVFLSHDIKKDCKLALDLLYLGIRIHGFITDNHEWYDLAILNLPILSIDSLKTQNDGNISIVLPIMYKNDEHHVVDFFGEACIDASAWNLNSLSNPFNIWAIQKMVFDASQRRIIVYGLSDTSKELCMLLSSININVSYIVDEETTSSYRITYDDSEEILCRPIMDLLGEDYNDIKVYTDNSKDFMRMKEFGLKEGVEFADYIHNYSFCSVPIGYDPLLGYNYNVYDIEKSCPGCVEYGSDEGNCIVTMGGSTVDGAFDPYYSWPKQLHSLLNDINLQIVNAGCQGYNSSQDLQKLARDIIVLSPKLIIHYGGYNDVALKDPKTEYIEWPFYNYYLIDLAKSLGALGNQGRYSLSIESGKYHLGIKRSPDRWKTLESNIRMMRSVCEEMGIDYVFILQPCLYSKRKYWSAPEKEMYLAIESSEICEKQWTSFYDAMKKSEFSKPWFYDLTDALNQYEGVYLDECHLNKKGNGIIANIISDIVKERICIY